MNLLARSLVVVGTLLLAGALIRFLFPGSDTFDASETVGMLLVGGLGLAFGVYLGGLTRAKKGADLTGQEAKGSNTSAETWAMPYWLVFALVVTGLGGSQSSAGALGYLFFFVVAVGVFWVIEVAIRAALRMFKRPR